VLRYATGMSVGDPFPWLAAAIGLLDVRRHDRMLACDVDVGSARSLAALVGKDGELVVVCRDAAIADELAALEMSHVRVLARCVSGGEQFGTFDAMLVVPPTGPLLPIGAYVDLARANLRPGGRLVLDVPGPEMVRDLMMAWEIAGIDGARAAPLCGIADDELATALRNGGLRDVHAVLGAHLVHLGSPADLVALFAAPLALDDADVLALTHAVVRQKGGTGPIDALVHRTRVLARR
jgi:hypothetical protein